VSRLLFVGSKLGTVSGYVHGRGHPAILQTGKSPGPVVGAKDPTKIFLKKKYFS
jgi:hypothetical protein